jgi:AcrR family transcriptional regulator
LLDAAVLLFAERGLRGASLREINEAAGQRNTNALHYHFGDRDGLIRALTARHTAALGDRVRQLYEECTTEGTTEDLPST